MKTADIRAELMYLEKELEIREDEREEIINLIRGAL